MEKSIYEKNNADVDNCGASRQGADSQLFPVKYGFSSPLDREWELWDRGTELKTP